MIALSEKATVPVLFLTDKRVLDESLEIMRWTLAQSGDPARLFTDASQQQAQLDLIAINDSEFKYWLDRYKYHVRYPELPLEHYRQKAAQFLQQLEVRLSSTEYLFGSRPQLADIAIMPFVRQFSGVEREWFQSGSYPVSYTHLTLPTIYSV